MYFVKMAILWTVIKVNIQFMEGIDCVGVKRQMEVVKKGKWKHFYNKSDNSRGKLFQKALDKPMTLAIDFSSFSHRTFIPQNQLSFRKYFPITYTGCINS